VAEPAQPRRAGAAGAFGLTWLAYATYYFGRKGWSVSKARIGAELGLGKPALATIDAGYLGAYAAGQFLSGVLGDRIGARRLIAFGMIGAAIACAAFGSARGAGLLFLAFAWNGLLQSTGWPGTTKAMAEWTEPRRRGAVMGVWCTCYQAGGLAATVLCTYLLVHHGWRSAFRLPALAIAAVGLLVLARLRPGPYRTDHHQPAPLGRPAPGLLRSPTLWSYGASFFFVKLIRYSFLFWLPFYLHTAVGFDDAYAGYLATSFEVGGVLGAVALGALSDLAPRRSRAGVAAASMIVLAAVMAFYARLAPTGALPQFLLVAAIGALLVGPDSLLTGVAAQEAAGPASAARAAGFVNGCGSVGALLQGWITVGVESRWGWSSLFYLFVLLSLVSAACLLPALTRRTAPA
jgi:sugar phosphate permease